MIHTLDTVVVSSIVFVLLIIVFAATLVVFVVVGIAVAVKEVVVMFAVFAALMAILGAYIYRTSRFSAATTIAVQIAVTYWLFELSNHVLLG